MTTAQSRTATASRVGFRQPVSSAGFLDAAWWPRSRDLAAELPALMTVLWTAGRDVTRVTYNLHAWDTAPRRMQIEGRSVRLGGFASSDPVTVRLSDPWGRERIDVLVIAPDTAPDVAERIFAAVETADNPYRAHEILERTAGTAAAAATS
jgi:hypothetical protein